MGWAPRTQNGSCSMVGPRGHSWFAPHQGQTMPPRSYWTRTQLCEMVTCWRGRKQGVVVQITPKGLPNLGSALYSYYLLPV